MLSKRPPGVSDASWKIFEEVKANHAKLQACVRPSDDTSTETCAKIAAALDELEKRP